ncbi:putative mitochondrial deoxyuridine triphosphatase, putative,dUTP diphosphatase [Leptomonas pyrrhocoris]|uniref:Putative mitochondrial deoxyuridine triphosphatase, putative,dUTP diphosphatase n=1 Tax=Leptomonas pyrrhocoris TaxID=157538 RepID=A0A0M9G6U4_LEPPY|nr:putative mitochondrial deoxyuridine triphosphatase, putative,dUTP diphosphatase [Leptomonas pyrrhocoris]KPA83653.1 putative mitochondrial deoxyuridine triphosphatase, putative,dUTP diphosphatase [Leptomonas pyrrhocoris]|eukprot:XP_015662092.1 putative mitochondrial deoxyuridine triphosphatase, putative,dUTP diphosphatase [Leptomonas pyrrhocoris]
MKRARTVTLTPAILSSLGELQDGLNAMIDPSWRSVRSLNDWGLAITMESTELLDSYPWKWWKNINATPDFANVKIELVDILHFSLSGAMQIRSMPEDSIPEVSRKPLKDVMHVFCPSKECASDPHGILFFPLSDTQNTIASFRNVIQLANAYRFDVITESIIAAAEDMGFNLVSYYVAKHTLNCIRQLGGYKDGSYVKVNNGVEDNVLLHDCIKSFSLEDVLDDNKYVVSWNQIITRVYEAFQVKECDRKDAEYWFRYAKEDRSVGSK